MANYRKCFGYANNPAVAHLYSMGRYLGCAQIVIESLCTLYSTSYAGDIMALNLLGQPMVIVNSVDHAINLLDKRSTIYSDRPTLVMCGTLSGWNKTLILQRYGPVFREIRRYLHQIIGSRNNVGRFSATIESTTTKFLKHLLQEPDKFSDHIRW